MTMISSVVLLFVACIVLILFYPYTDNFPAFPRITQTQSGADGDPINMVFVGSQEQILHSFPEVVEYRITARKQGAMDELIIEVEDHLQQPARIADELR